MQWQKKSPTNTRRYRSQAFTDRLLIPSITAKQSISIFVGLVAAHLKRHDNDAEKSLAAISSAESILNSRRQQIPDADVQTSFGYVGSGTL